jgi:hypothetical protein
MKASQDFINQLEELYQAYEQEVKENVKKKTTIDTYLRHSGTFVRWVKNDFEPGITLKNK